MAYKITQNYRRNIEDNAKSSTEKVYDALKVFYEYRTLTFNGIKEKDITGTLHQLEVMQLVKRNIDSKRELTRPSIYKTDRNTLREVIRSYDITTKGITTFIEAEEYLKNHDYPSFKDAEKDLKIFMNLDYNNKILNQDPVILREKLAKLEQNYRQKSKEYRENT
jgi:hypothetical protein